ncbi:GNAT family N-acetyltransferase [Bizionia sediminis]|uniref:GNAT family N-acetyltransferase n=1 Tax=Bizionia sediminis TaxID=1737064 RepID=A0ABW5KUA6_9FLAO
MISIQIKSFSELTLHELYTILQLRAEVFVLEQTCLYQDIDGHDADGLHILGFKNNEIVAYARAFKSGIYFKEASIGRVLVKKSERKHHYGYVIMEAAIGVLEKTHKEAQIKISAQTYLQHFYAKLGFRAIGTSYLEDGIPHIAMVKP